MGKFWTSFRAESYLFCPLISSDTFFKSCSSNCLFGAMNWILRPRGTRKRQLRCKIVHKHYFVCHFELLEPKLSSVHSDFIPFKPPANRDGPYKCNEDTCHICQIASPLRLVGITLHVPRTLHVITIMIFNTQVSEK